ncbi:MAG: hypothetical protein HY738_04900, partial [Bacteroidia bacterium]|nr:hypothetical protein [Bacteroidia bacterium]
MFFCVTSVNNITMKNDPVQNNIHEEGLDIKKIVIKIFLHWYLFVIAITIAYSITYFINRYSNPVYQISSSILIREKGSNVGSVENIIEDLGFRAPRVKKEIENEIGILKSYSLSKKAIAELDFQISYFSIGDIKISELYGDALFFRVILDTSHIQLLEHKVYINILAADKYRLTINDDLNISKVLKFGQSFENEMFKFKLILNSKKFNHENISNYDNGFYFFINDLHSVINEYRGKFTIELIEKKATFLVLISYGNVPQKEANYLNKLGEVYLRLELEEKNMA